MKIEVLSAEIGSTITAVSGFEGFRDGKPRLAGQGSAPTSVEQGDVRIGLNAAIDELKKNLGTGQLEWERFSASSSAAGGLRMSVHGLVYDMTVRAAREAALGAGANLCGLSSGEMGPADIEHMIASKPNILLIAGGVDYGEKKTTLKNAGLIRDALVQESLTIPVIYAGNTAARDEIRDIFAGTGIHLRIADNVYPRIDELVIEPTRRIIQEVFEEHITDAPGMKHIRDLVDGTIMPVPGAVMRAAKLARGKLGDLIVFDVGGATSDLHSVCADSPDIGRMLLSPEPEARRTVEGDLGVYVNRTLVMETAEAGLLAGLFAGRDADELRRAVEALPPKPETDEDKHLAGELTYIAAKTALERHAGRYRDLYTLSGKQRFAEGKDLTAVTTVVGTGGALTRLPGGRKLLQRVLDSGSGRELFPPVESRILLDENYIMAAAGVLSVEFPEAAAELILESLGGVNNGRTGHRSKY